MALDLSELSLESQTQILRVFADTQSIPVETNYRGFPLSMSLSLQDCQTMWSNFNKVPNGPRNVASDLIIEALQLNRGVYGQALEGLRSSGVRLFHAIENYGFETKASDYPFDEEVSLLLFPW